ncbi:MAG: hypothetical protein WCI27_09850, partial [Candidatus Omnitrophota bacterium]
MKRLVGVIASLCDAIIAINRFMRKMILEWPPPNYGHKLSISLPISFVFLPPQKQDILDNNQREMTLSFMNSGQYCLSCFYMIAAKNQRGYSSPPHPGTPYVTPRRTGDKPNHKRL